jgi:hypothetical protein
LCGVRNPRADRRQDVDLDAITRHLGSAVRYSSYSAQITAIPNKHQIELVATFRMGIYMDKSIESE